MQAVGLRPSSFPLEPARLTRSSSSPVSLLHRPPLLRLPIGRCHNEVRALHRSPILQTTRRSLLQESCRDETTHHVHNNSATRQDSPIERLALLSCAAVFPCRPPLSRPLCSIAASTTSWAIAPQGQRPSSFNPTTTSTGRPLVAATCRSKVSGLRMRTAELQL